MMPYLEMLQQLAVKGIHVSVTERKVMRELTIGNTRIADDTDAFVIAEVGSNHGGNIETCKQLFKAAADCGVDAVKLQKRDNRTLFTREAYDAPYNSEHAYGDTYGKHREALEFDFEQYEELKAYAEGFGLVFFATAFDMHSADFLQSLGVPCFKIASGDLTNLPLIQHIAAFGKPMIISTGGGTFKDVARIAKSFPGYGNTWGTTQFPTGEFEGAMHYHIDAPVAFLQCTASYPVIPEEMNLRAIDTYRQKLPNTVIGLSDHYDGIAMGPVAYALGARIFEKHFTLNHTWKGSDQAFSFEPEGMKRFVRDIHRTREALGDGVKRRYPSEDAPLRKMAKSLYAASDLPAGHVLTAADIVIKTPVVEGACPPWMLDSLIGKTLRPHLQAEWVIRPEDVE